MLFTFLDFNFLLFLNCIEVKKTFISFQEIDQELNTFLSIKFGRIK